MVLTLGVVEIGEEVLARVQVQCGREEREEKDKHEETDNERSSTHHGWHGDGTSARYTATLGGSS